MSYEILILDGNFFFEKLISEISSFDFFVFIFLNELRVSDFLEINTRCSPYKYNFFDVKIINFRVRGKTEI